MIAAGLGRLVDSMQVFQVLCPVAYKMTKLENVDDVKQNNETSPLYLNLFPHT